MKLILLISIVLAAFCGMAPAQEMPLVCSSTLIDSFSRRPMPVDLIYLDNGIIQTKESKGGVLLLRLEFTKDENRTALKRRVANIKAYFGERGLPKNRYKIVFAIADRYYTWVHLLTAEEARSYPGAVSNLDKLKPAGSTKVWKKTR